jgi:hypothetical protein
MSKIEAAQSESGVIHLLESAADWLLEPVRRPYVVATTPETPRLW